LLRFAVAVFGRLPMITPVYAFAVLIAAAGLMVVPPLVAVCLPERPLRRPTFVTAICLTAIAIGTGAAALAPAYSYEHPLRRHVRALQEPDTGAAIWEIASIEPGLDLAPGAPTGWTIQKDVAHVSIPWGRFSDP